MARFQTGCGPRRKTLPVRAELTDPHLWLDRVGGRGRGPGRRQRPDPADGPLLRRSRRSVGRSAGAWRSSPRVTLVPGPPASGGADSLALAAALAHEVTRACGSARGRRPTVDHGLQAGSRGGWPAR